MKKDGLVSRTISRMRARLPRWGEPLSEGSTSTAAEREEAWLVKQATALLADTEGAVLAGNCVVCEWKRGWKPADDTDAEPKPAILSWKVAFALELLLKGRGRGSGTWDLERRENRTHDLKRVWDSLHEMDREKARHGLKQYSDRMRFDDELEKVRNAYREFQYLTDSPHRDCRKALKSLVMLSLGFMKGCYDRPRFANVEAGILNIKTLALDDFSATERAVLEACKDKGFFLVVRMPGATRVVVEPGTPQRQQEILQPQTPRNGRELLEAIRRLERIRLLEQCGQTQYNTDEHNSVPATVWELTKAGFDACRKAPGLIITDDSTTGSR